MASIRLKCGRSIGTSEHGDPKGSLLLWFHGTPGSRTWAPPDPEATRAAGVRIVVLERPGFGASDFQPDRRVLDWPSDVAHVADALGAERFAIAGVSGAGPYLAACAYALPERVRAVGMIGVVAPLEAPGVRAGMTLRRRALFRAARHAPRGAMLLRALGPERIYRMMTSDAPPCDRRVIEATWIAKVAMTREAMRAGPRGYAWDLALATRPWGFPLEAIRVPVYIWHGERDVTTPVAMGRYLAAAIPGARARFLPDQGHFLSGAIWPELLALVGATARRR